jgi:hypothetical protein
MIEKNNEAIGEYRRAVFAIVRGAELQYGRNDALAIVDALYNRYHGNEIQVNRLPYSATSTVSRPIEVEVIDTEKRKKK